MSCTLPVTHYVMKTINHTIYHYDNYTGSVSTQVNKNLASDFGHASVNVVWRHGHVVWKDDRVRASWGESFWKSGLGQKFVHAPRSPYPETFEVTLVFVQSAFPGTLALNTVSWYTQHMTMNRNKFMWLNKRRVAEDNYGGHVLHSTKSNEWDPDRWFSND